MLYICIVMSYICLASQSAEKRRGTLDGARTVQNGARVLSVRWAEGEGDWAIDSRLGANLFICLN